jgi:hypothetical protein
VVASSFGWRPPQACRASSTAKRPLLSGFDGRLIEPRNFRSRSGSAREAVRSAVGANGPEAAINASGSIPHIADSGRPGFTHLMA